MFIGVLSAYMSMKVSDSLELELDSCDLPCGFWELYVNPLEEQSELLTAEPFLQPCIFLLFLLENWFYHVALAS